jgi:alpha/beta superfamily hydrolase
MTIERPEVIPVDAEVRLEARVAVPPHSGRAAVIAHPHPLYGGDLDNPVVVRIAEVCQAAGLATVRFNFRGVGRSTGTHGGGVAERADLAAAAGYAGQLVSDPDGVALAGYSFGAIVVAAVAPGRRLAGVALVAPPLGMTGPDGLGRLDEISAPVLIIGAGRDEYCSRDLLEQLRVRTPRAEVHVIEDSGHFFFGKLYPLGERVAVWARQIAGAA